MSKSQITPAGVDWLNALGQAVTDDLDGCRRVAVFDDAVRAWRDERFAEMRVLAWEACRVECVSSQEKKTAWGTAFREVKAWTDREFLENPRAQELAGRIGCSTEDLVSLLPFLGAAAEGIAFPGTEKHQFFRRQIQVLMTGHWVCGWDGAFNRPARDISGVCLYY